MEIDSPKYYSINFVNRSLSPILPIASQVKHVPCMHFGADFKWLVRIIVRND